MTTPFHPPYLGAAYYPEDWPLEQIDDDIRLMLDAGMTVMRVGEFAWARMEPEEGQYDFGWLHQVVDKLAQAGIATILGTPTATPPIWLTQRYPEVLQVRDIADGVTAQHGGRCHFCPNSPVYRRHCARIVTRMAQEFGRDPNVIGWQVDNEVYPGGRGCRCPVCLRKFQERLQAQFGTIEALNRAWGLNIFSLAYQSFAQAPFPRADTWHHPSLVNAWMRFQADSYVEYVAAQAGILRQLAAPQPVGTDMMPFGGIGHHAMNRPLDVVQFNHYNDMNTLWESTFWFEFLRPLKDRPFWNTETSTCWNGSTAANGYREPGFSRANSWLPIALGGEANLYWLWRAHWSGHEVMHGAVVSSCGRPLHIIDEVREVAAGFRAAADFINGTRPEPARIGLHFSSLAWTLFESQPMVNGFKYLRRLLDSAYRPVAQAQYRLDVIDPAAPLDGYQLICSPFLPALDESGLRQRLRAWIEAGGTWVAGPLTDIRTLEATKYTHAPFGSLEEWSGAYCRYEIPADPCEFTVRWNDGRQAAGSAWYTGFEPRGAEVLASYTDGPLSGLAAVLRRRVGRGQAVLLGTMPQPADLQRLVSALAAEAGLSPAADASPNVLVVPRAGPAGPGLMAVEYENRPAQMTLDREMTDLLTGRRCSGRVDVPPYGVMVLI